VAKTFRLEIHTPFRRFFSGDVAFVVMRVADGEMGVLADRAAFCAPLDNCLVSIHAADGTIRVAAVSSGIAECMKGVLTLLAGAAEWPEEVDRARAEAAIARAEQRMKDSGSDTDALQSVAAIARARNRIRLVAEKDAP